MILHVVASFVFIGALVMQDIIDLTFANLDALVTPTPEAVYYLLCVSSFVS